MQSKNKIINFILIGLIVLVTPIFFDVSIVQAIHGSTTRVSVDSLGNQANNLSARPAISADGRYVVFRSFANNLVANDTNDVADIFLHDRQTNTTERVNVDSSGNQANMDSPDISDVSDDGRFVTFWSIATNLVPGGNTVNGDVYLRDRQNGTTERVSVSSFGIAGDH